MVQRCVNYTRASPQLRPALEVSVIITIITVYIFLKLKASKQDVYVFDIHIVFILGDLSCMESSDSFADYPHGLPLNCNK